MKHWRERTSTRGIHFPLKGGISVCTSARAFTLLELMVTVIIILILSSIAVLHLQEAQTRTKISSSKARMKTLSGAIEIYRVDYGHYPLPRISPPDDPFGIVASTALAGLTSPLSYVGPEAFKDPFGALKIQIAGSSLGISLTGDPFGLPVPGFNPDRSLLYIYYPHFSWLLSRSGFSREAYNVISVGPDLKDSFILYFPFPELFPEQAAEFGVMSAWDTVYDPTNGVISGGDVAYFGGDLPRTGLIGGGH
jgi:prepilin-type N-terminal cleavage/methylation domain-containing protein